MIFKGGFPDELLIPVFNFSEIPWGTRQWRFFVSKGNGIPSVWSGGWALPSDDSLRRGSGKVKVRVSQYKQISLAFMLCSLLLPPDQRRRETEDQVLRVTGSPVNLRCFKNSSFCSCSKASRGSPRCALLLIALLSSNCSLLSTARTFLRPPSYYSLTLIFVRSSCVLPLIPYASNYW